MNTANLAEFFEIEPSVNTKKKSRNRSVM